MILVKLLSLLPIGINDCSKKTAKYFDLIDRISLSNKNEPSANYKGFSFNLSVKHERMVYYLFDNIVRYYKKTDLGKYIASKLNPGEVFVDIGANLGLYSYLAKQLGAYVISFEPEPSHADFINRNRQICDEFFTIALDQKEGTSKFYVGDKLNPGINSLVLGNQDFSNSDYKNSIDVRTKRLDSILQNDEKLQKVRLIKVDVEGAEYNVIRGMKAIFEDSYRPDIWCEVRNEHSNRNPDSYQNVVSFLSNYDYTPHLYKNRTLQPFTGNPERNVFDLLFLHTP